MKNRPSIKDMRLQADLENRLNGPGSLRISLLKQLEQVDAQVQKLAIEAADAGLPYRRIGELVGLTGSGVFKLVSRTRS